MRRLVKCHTSKRDPKKKEVELLRTSEDSLVAVSCDLQKQKGEIKLS